MPRYTPVPPARPNTVLDPLVAGFLRVEECCDRPKVFEDAGVEGLPAGGGLDREIEMSASPAGVEGGFGEQRSAEAGVCGGYRDGFAGGDTGVDGGEGGKAENIKSYWPGLGSEWSYWRSMPVFSKVETIVSLSVGILLSQGAGAEDQAWPPVLIGWFI